MSDRSALFPLVTRLKKAAALDNRDVDAIEALPITMKVVKANHAIVSAGERPSSCCLIVDGFVVRAKTTSSGDRQILAIHQPGDIPDLQSLYLHVMDHELTTLGECVLGFIPHDALRKLIQARPTIAEVLWRDTLIDAAIFREWILNVGQRDAASRISHLMMEIFSRLKLVGRTDGNSFPLPMTQTQLGEAVGLTSVHVNRTLQELRAARLLDMENGRVTIHNEDKLKRLAGFDPLYLHVQPSL